MKPNILKLGYLLLGLFAVLVIYLSYLQVVRGPALTSNPYNRRPEAYESGIKRGTVYDTRGSVLAETTYSQGAGKRVYPQGPAAAHLVGYISGRHGRTGIESAYDRHLLGMEGIDRVRNLVDRLLGRDRAGGHLVLTVDAVLQKLAADLLDDRRGAVVMLDTGSGAVRVMVSSPGFNPNYVDETWSRLARDPGSPLINRAIQGAYPPGSTIKVVVAAGALDVFPGLKRETFNCRGSLVVDGYRLNDTAAHGNVDLKKALAVSCNTVFARLGLKLKADGFHRAVESFGLKQDPGIGIPVRPGTMVAPAAMTPAELAASAIGQGEILVTPLHMALVASGIANRGVIMHPFVVEKFMDAQGQTVRQAVYRPWLTAATPEIAGVLKEGMVDAVQYGTAGAAGVPEMQVAGKTGSAQNPHGQTHAWFIGFAPADSPRLAAAVVLENAGSGGGVAAPIAGRLLSAAVNRGY